MIGPFLLLKLLQHKKQCEIASSSSQIEESGSADRQTANKHIDTKGKYPENTCRVCLKEADIDLPIFGGQSESDLSQALSTFAGIEIDEDDTYPKYFCQSCHTLLQGAILLRKTAQKSDRVLRSSHIHVTDSDRETDNFVICDNFDDTTGFEQKSYYCNKCDLEFENIEEYRDHNISVDHKNGQITCDKCNKPYSIKYYKTHRLIHESNFPYMCDICGKKFVAYGAFSRHRRTHLLKLPFKCTLCPYKGRFSDSLKVHMRSHTGERPYKCSECTARFINKSNLNKHMVTHTKDRNVKCETCGKGFTTKANLDMHVSIVHIRTKDHVCDVCSKAFETRKQMMRHQLDVHKRQKLRSGRTPIYLQIEKMKGNVET